MTMNTRHIEVVAAVIRRGDRIFATQRGYGEFKDWWEFPGGKMEPGETPQQALVREIRGFHLTMHCFWCTLASPELHLLEHEAARWLSKDELPSVRWLPADEGILQDIHAAL